MSQAQGDLLGDAPGSNPPIDADGIPYMPAELPVLPQDFRNDKPKTLQAIKDDPDSAYDWMLTADKRNFEVQARAEALKTRSDQQNAELQDLRQAQLEHNGAIQDLNNLLIDMETQRNNL
ncbi:MAG: hypothetical protein L6R37_008160, partial [Teloschistes peruensis]